jgi:solute carrier family 45 protein 1/2/4
MMTHHLNSFSSTQSNSNSRNDSLTNEFSKSNSSTGSSHSLGYQSNLSAALLSKQEEMEKKLFSEISSPIKPTASSAASKIVNFSGKDSVKILDGTEEGGETEEAGGEEEDWQLSRWEMLKLCIPVIPSQLGWAISEALLIPYLISLGVEETLANAIWLVNPLVGFFIQPLIGSVSDRCNSRWGRRRPFLLLFHVGIMVGILMIAFAAELHSLTFYSLLNWPAYTEQNYATTSLLIIVLSGCVLMELSNDLLTIPSRALLNDQLPESQLDQGNAWFATMSSFGAIIGLTMCFLPLQEYFPLSLLKTQLRATFVMCIFFILISNFMTMGIDSDVNWDLQEENSEETEEEENYNNEAAESAENNEKLAENSDTVHNSAGEEGEEGEETEVEAEGEAEEEGEAEVEHGHLGFWQSLLAFRLLPRALIAIWVTQFSWWLGLMQISFWWSTWCGVIVYGADPMKEPQQFYAGVQYGIIGSLVQSIVSFFAAQLLPWINNHLGVTRVYHISAVLFSLSTALLWWFRDKNSAMAYMIFTGFLYPVINSNPFILIEVYTGENDWEEEGTEEIEGQKGPESASFGLNSSPESASIQPILAQLSGSTTPVDIIDLNKQNSAADAEIAQLVASLKRDAAPNADILYANPLEPTESKDLGYLLPISDENQLYHSDTATETETETETEASSPSSTDSEASPRLIPTRKRSETEDTSSIPALIGATGSPEQSHDLYGYDREEISSGDELNPIEIPQNSLTPPISFKNNAISPGRKPKTPSSARSIALSAPFSSTAAPISLFDALNSPDIELLPAASGGHYEISVIPDDSGRHNVLGSRIIEVLQGSSANIADLPTVPALLAATAASPDISTEDYKITIAASPSPSPELPITIPPAIFRAESLISSPPGVALSSFSPNSSPSHAPESEFREAFSATQPVTGVHGTNNLISGQNNEEDGEEEGGEGREEPESEELTELSASTHRGVLTAIMNLSMGLSQIVSATLGGVIISSYGDITIVFLLSSILCLAVNGVVVFFGFSTYQEEAAEPSAEEEEAAQAIKAAEQAAAQLGSEDSEARARAEAELRAKKLAEAELKRKLAQAAELKRQKREFERRLRLHQERQLLREILLQRPLTSPPPQLSSSVGGNRAISEATGLTGDGANKVSYNNHDNEQIEISVVNWYPSTLCTD